MSRRAAWLLPLLAASACADRGLASQPSSTPGTGTWAAVVVAAVLAAAVLGALIVLPARRPGGSALASWVLALQAGGVVVAGAILIGAAVRSEQLLPAPGEPQEPAASLIRLSALDGRQSGFFALVVIVTLVLGGLGVVALALAARCAADDDPMERVMATSVLGVEVLGSLACAVAVVLGFRHAGFVLPALALPILVVAVGAAFPRRADRGPGR